MRKKVVNVLVVFIFILLFMEAKVFAKGSTARIYGQDRYETSVKLSQSTYKNAATVILATGEQYPDALSSAPLSKAYDAPILLTNKDQISDCTLNEIKRLNAKKVILIGSSGAVSNNIEETLKNLGYEVERIEGKDRYETSLNVVKKLGVGNEIIIATGENFPDALSIAPFAYKKNIPILLSSKNSIKDEALNYLKGINNLKVYIIGGPSVVSSDVESNFKNVERLYGNDRFETNMKILDRFKEEVDYSNVYVAIGSNFPDALCTSYVAGKNNSPLVLLGSDVLDSQAVFLRKNNASDFTIIGGETIINKIQEDRLKSIPLSVVEVIDCLAQINKEQAYTLPNEIAVKLNDKTIKNVAVKWDNQIPSFKIGVNYFLGEIKDYNRKIIFSVIVNDGDNKVDVDNITFRSNLVNYAFSFIGTPYEWGGNGPITFDCSGFTKYVYNNFGIKLLRTTSEQITQGNLVDKVNLNLGDLVLFGSNGVPSHVGIYLGNNMYIHSPHTGDFVKTSTMTRTDFLCGRDIIGDRKK